MIKRFKAFESFSCGVQFFAPDDERTYAEGKPCAGFGAVRYGEGSVYCGDLYFDGKEYRKLGFGRQDFMLSEFGGLSKYRNIRKAFFIGAFDYRKTDWIYGNGVLYFVDGNNKPACFMKGFFEGLSKVRDYEGAFDASCLAEGYTSDMECEIDDWSDVFDGALSDYGRITSFENMFIGDSYFEFWNSREYAGELFYEAFDGARNLNLGVGGTHFYDWPLFLARLGGISAPKRIFINLGFNDIHAGHTAEQAFEDCKEILGTLKGLFPDAEYYLLNVVKAPSFGIFYSEEEKFNAMTKAAEGRLGVQIVDMRSEIERAGKSGNCFHADSVHLNAYGYRVFSSVVKKITD